MLDFDASKLLIIGVVALVVVGPKDLPRVLRQVGQMVTKLRRMASEFQGQFMDAMKEADLQDLRDEVAKLKDTAKLDVNFDPVHDVRTEISQAMEPAIPAVSRSEPSAEVSHAEMSRGSHETAVLPRPERADATALRLDSPEDAPTMPADPVEAENAAFRTTAETAGAMGAPVPPDPARRRKIMIPKRRPPGDRVGLPRAGTAMAGRGRLILPPRRDPRT